MKWICDEYGKSSYGQKMSTLIEYSCIAAIEAEELPLIFSELPTTSAKFKKATALTQVRWLTWRTYVDYKRNSPTYLLRFVSYMVRY